MELRQLTTFQAVATTLSFTRAAELLSYAQSSVTAQIQSLEEELGVPLFERLGKRIKLTAAGDRLLWYAERMNRLAEEARAIVPGGDEPAGVLHLGSVESLLTYRLPPLLQRFRQRYPQVELHVMTGICADLRRNIMEGRVDAALTLDEPGSFRHPLVADALSIEALELIVRPGHPLLAKSQITPRDLHGYPFLATEGGCSYRGLLERLLTEAGAIPSATMEFGSIEAIKQCVMADMGFGVLPRVAVAAELAQGRLASLPWAGPPLQFEFQAIYHKDKWISPALHAFLSIARELAQEWD